MNMAKRPGAAVASFLQKMTVGRTLVALAVVYSLCTPIIISDMLAMYGLLGQNVRAIETPPLAKLGGTIVWFAPLVGAIVGWAASRLHRSPLVGVAALILAIGAWFTVHAVGVKLIRQGYATAPGSIPLRTYPRPASSPGAQAPAEGGR